MHALRLKATNCRGGTKVSLSRLPAVLQVAPVAPPLLAVIASGLGTPHGSRKQRSHSTPLYTVSWGQGKGSNPRHLPSPRTSVPGRSSKPRMHALRSSLTTLWDKGFVRTSAGLFLPQILFSSSRFRITTSCSHKNRTSMWRTRPTPLREAMAFAALLSTHKRIRTAQPARAWMPKAFPRTPSPWHSTQPPHSTWLGSPVDCSSSSRCNPPRLRHLRFRRVSRSPAQSLSENTFNSKSSPSSQNSYNNLATRFSCSQLPAVDRAIFWHKKLTATCRSGRSRAR